MEGPVYPGDVITDPKSLKNHIILGPGLKRNDTQPNTFQVTRAGVLNFKAPNTYWVDHAPRRYIPKRGDLVVGTVTKKSGDLLKIDIGGGELAALSLLAFEGATKKQKPDLQVGDVIYGKLLSAHREMEPELVCVDSYFKAGKMGPLSNDGFVFNIGMGLVNRLLEPRNPLLSTLGKKFAFEIVVGMNGRVWVNAKSLDNVLSIVECLRACENQDDATIGSICNQRR